MKTFKHIIYLIVVVLLFNTAHSQNKLDLLILNKKYNKALLLIEQQNSQKQDVQLLIKKGLIYNSLQNYQEAEKAYRKALQLEPDNVEILVEMAECQTLLGNQTEAEKHFEKAVKLDPDNLIVAAKLGRNYIKQKKYKNGYTIFSEIYGNDSSNIYWNKQLAFCAYRIQNRLQAIQLYESVLKQNPKDLGTTINLIHCYSWKKEPEKIITLIDSSLNNFSYNTELLFERAKFFFRNKLYPHAESAYKNYFDAGGDSIYDITVNYGISTYFAKHEEKALEIFNNLNRANPNDPIVMYYQALCYRKLHNFIEAEKYMVWAIEATTPDYVADMYHILGQIYGQQRKFEESIDAMVKANHLNPQNKEVLFEIATTYEEFNSNKTLALNYYQIYLKEVGESGGGDNVDYALQRITKLKEDIFMGE